MRTDIDAISLTLIYLDMGLFYICISHSRTFSLSTRYTHVWTEYLQLHSIDDKFQWTNSDGGENDDSMQFIVPYMSTLIDFAVFKWSITSVLSKNAVLHSLLAAFIDNNDKNEKWIRSLNSTSNTYV